MKLIECYVENFGKLSRYAHRFEGGMNTLLQDNGWGKTTFASFIKAMLYGLSTSRSQDLTLNERSRLNPWQGGTWGGTLTFTDGEGTYRIERTFGTKESQDTFHLFDALTGLPSDKYSSNLGEELFGIDAAGYERSTFISERITTPGGDKDYTGIQAKLVDLGDLADYEIAIKQLNRRRQHYYLQSGNGAITEVEHKLSLKRRELTECEEALRKTNELNRTAHALDSKRQELEATALRLEREAEASVTLRETRALEAHKEALEENCRKAREQVSSCRAYLSGMTPSVREVEEQMRVWRYLQEEKREEVCAKPLSLIFPVLCSVFGLLLVVLGVVFATSMPVAPLLLVPLGVLLFGAAVILSFMRTRALQTMKSQQARRAEYERHERELNGFLEDYPIVRADDTLTDRGEMLWAIRTKLDDLRRAQEREQEANAALAAFRTSHPALFGAAPQPEDEEGARRAEILVGVRGEIEQIRQQRMACERDIARYASAAGNYSACQQEIASLEGKLATYKKSLYIIQTTQQLLTNAKTNLTTRYLTDIQSHFRHYMQLLTVEDKGTIFSDEYETEAFTVTADFQVNITKFGVTRPATYLSRGGRDLVALCLRFSICDALFGDKKPPLILDDPFINLDDDKTAAAMRLLREIAKERQILYICCHSSRM